LEAEPTQEIDGDTFISVDRIETVESDPNNNPVNDTEGELIKELESTEVPDVTVNLTKSNIDTPEKPCEVKTWVHKTCPYLVTIELDSAEVYFDNNNFGSFEYMPFDTSGDITSIYLKSRKNIWGIIYKQEVKLILLYKKPKVIEKDPSSTETDTLDIFPDISYQDYPYPTRTLTKLEEEPKLEKSFLGKYKWPISLSLSFLSWLLFYLNQKLRRKKKSKKDKPKYGHPYFWKIKIPSTPDIELCEEVEKQVHLLRIAQNRIPIPDWVQVSIRPYVQIMDRSGQQPECQGHQYLYFSLQLGYQTLL